MSGTHTRTTHVPTATYLHGSPCWDRLQGPTQRRCHGSDGVAAQGFIPTGRPHQAHGKVSSAHCCMRSFCGALLPSCQQGSLIKLMVLCTLRTAAVARCSPYTAAVLRIGTPRYCCSDQETTKYDIFGATTRLHGSTSSVSTKQDG